MVTLQHTVLQLVTATTQYQVVNFFSFFFSLENGQFLQIFALKVSFNPSFGINSYIRPKDIYIPFLFYTGITPCRWCPPR